MSPTVLKTALKVEKAYNDKPEEEAGKPEERVRQKGGMDAWICFHVIKQPTMP